MNTSHRSGFGLEDTRHAVARRIQRAWEVTENQVTPAAPRATATRLARSGFTPVAPARATPRFALILPFPAPLPPPPHHPQAA